MLKRLKNIEGKTNNQLDLIRDQGNRQLDRFEKGLSNKEFVSFYDGPDNKIRNLVNKAKDETTENITDEKKVFYVEISGKPFSINKYTNLSFFGSQLFTEKISLKEAQEEQRKISDIIDDLEKKIDPEKKPRPSN